MALLIALPSCGGDSTGPGDEKIGPDGGSVSLESGAVSLSVPAGALSGNVDFTATPTTSVPTSDLLVAGSTYDIGPSGTTFAVPVTLTLSYDPSSLPDDVGESELGLFKVVGSDWELMANATVNTAAHTVSGQVTSLSLFGAMGLPVATVEVSPATATVEPGGTVQLTATLKASDGRTLTLRTVIWTSSNSSVATVDVEGLVTAVGEGTATITAQAEGKSDTAAVTVTIPVASVDVTPATGTLNAGQTLQLTATPKDGSGNTLSRSVTWSSSNDAVATVDQTGFVTAVSEGTATITATSEGTSGTAAITVNDQVSTVEVTPSTNGVNLGATVQLTATVKGATGNVLTRTVTWATSNGAVATVDASGLVTGASEGTATITATADGVDGTATVTVSVPVNTVDVTPATSQVNVSATVQLTATPKDINGNPIVRPVTWSSSDDAVATVDQAGLVTGVAEGTVTITATSGGVDGTAAVTVNDPVTTVEVTPAASTINVAETVQLTAVAKGAAGNVISGGTVTWASSSNTVATVDQSGLVTAAGEGTATITATVDGVDGTAQVTVPLNIPSLAGNWSGVWVNTTFGSTGPVTIVIAVDEQAKTVQFTLDVDGPAFGGGDPPPVTYNGTYADGVMTVSGTNASFGDLNLTWSADAVNGTLTNLPPASGINSVTLAGTGNTTQLDLTYAIDGQGWSANGTFSLTKQ